MTIQFGIAPIAWSNDDLPALGRDTPLETCLRESREAGYSGTETGGKFPMDPDVLGPLLQRHGLQLVSGWCSGGLLQHSLEEEKRRIAAQLHTFRTLGAQVMVYAETTDTVQNRRDTPVMMRPRLCSDEIKRYGEKLTALADFMSSEGVAMAYHHHMGTVIETEAEIDVLMVHSGESVGLLLDTGHLVFAGGDPLAVLHKHGRRINHVHMKDVRRPVLEQVHRREMSFLDAVLAGVFTVPGDGMIEYQPIAEALHRLDYNGWVVVVADQDPKKAPPLKYAKMGLEYLQRVFHQAGFYKV